MPACSWQKNLQSDPMLLAGDRGYEYASLPGSLHTGEFSELHSAWLVPLPAACCFQSGRSRDLRGMPWPRGWDWLPRGHGSGGGMVRRDAPGSPAEPMRAAWGITTDGKPVFIGLAPGAGESFDAWTKDADEVLGKIERTKTKTSSPTNH